ncbi:hypothetical protein BK816_00515 [Boudabousia tangfeifanii]|uniref:protein-tyrosine-phosphatase n=1 Tax=Boudabousia tangfeifanii TaxID=1912795 RepID=A0A1D9MID9_9ACTO|nr:low molecular weight protein-tyrosine-phosphatase [Boudabousia tangfeifanii]AOZ71959.1 hypothetical protein BK816_00515 [Boudabousia tangfeifanii]
MTKRVLTVCHGNICRSTMAEQVLRADLPAFGLDVQLDSAGVSSEESGNPIDRRAAAVLRKAGYPLGSHRARQVQASELPSFDLVLAATNSQVSRLRQLALQAGMTEAEAADRIRLYRDFDTDGGGDMPDPWYGGPEDFKETLATIQRCTENIANHLAD